MDATQRKTPGVYITETSAFGVSIVGAETAVPAFVGYTETAKFNDQDLTNIPTSIDSMASFVMLFGGAHHEIFTITEVGATDFYDFSVIDPGIDHQQAGDAKAGPATSTTRYYGLSPQRQSFLLYDSLRLFFDNGGGRCFIVSVGTYGASGVDEHALALGIDALATEVGPTMLVVPDAVNLPADTTFDSTPVPLPFTSSAFANIAQKMMQQAAELADRVALLDLYGALDVDTDDPDRELSTALTAYRGMIGTDNRSYGVAYFPFLNATVVLVNELDFTNIDQTPDPAIPDTKSVLQVMLGYQNDSMNWQGWATPTDIPSTSAWYRVDELIREIPVALDNVAKGDNGAKAHLVQLQQILDAELPLMRQIMSVMVSHANRLPSSAAMAGIYTQIDRSRGVWNAPANVTISSVTTPTFTVTDSQQDDMNIPLDGLAVNAIRELPGRGTVAWGARTLDGNSSDYRYIHVRRTLIYIEQSIKASLRQLVFAANDSATWMTATSMCSAFLHELWNQGGLVGDKPSDAFTVECGLGSSMTAQDILGGYLRLQISLAILYPAEFIFLTFTQAMAEGPRWR